MKPLHDLLDNSNTLNQAKQATKCQFRLMVSDVANVKEQCSFSLRIEKKFPAPKDNDHSWKINERAYKARKI